MTESRMRKFWKLIAVSCLLALSSGATWGDDRESLDTSRTLVRRVVSTCLLFIVGVMIGIVLLCGLLFWMFERKVNENTFGGGRRLGIGMGV